MQLTRAPNDLVGLRTIETSFDDAILSDTKGNYFMTQTVSVDEAQTKLPDLLAQALAGNEVIITEHGTPVARLVPVVAHTKKKRVAGLNRGTISTSEDFDEPLPDEFWLGQE